MNYTIIWSEQAENDLLSILEYLLHNWGNGSATKFKEKVDNQVGLIASFPKMHSITSFIPGLRRCVVVKQVSLYYLEIEINKEIKIVRLLDNRLDMNTIMEELEKEV